MIWAVGIGPGDVEALTGEARAVLEACDVVVGYRPYLEFLGDLIADKRLEASGMRKEVERCQRALELHREGLRVAVVSSGDAGIYGMAGLLMELDPEAEINVVPGVTAAQAAAARLGAPLMNDFAVLSLSDLLTPREEVLRRVEAVAGSDLVTCLYNPTSRRRRPLFEQAISRFAAHRGEDRLVGWVRNAYREDEEIHVTTLGELPGEPVDMWSMVIIGSSRTEIVGDRLVTRRGYVEKYLDPAEHAAQDHEFARSAAVSESAGAPGGGKEADRRLYVLGGTSFARGIVDDLEAAGWSVRLSVATALGADELESEPSGGVQVGRLDVTGLADELAAWRPAALVDASHPYARELHETACKAAEAHAIPLLRAARAPWRAPEGVEARMFASPETAIAAVKSEGRRPFLTVGARGLEPFAKAGVAVAARMLPTPDSLHQALAAGMDPEGIVAAYPPYDADFTVACLRRFECDVIVSKEAGREGGMDEKAEAARRAGAELWIIERPSEPGEVYRDAATLIAALESVAGQSAARDTKAQESTIDSSIPPSTIPEGN